jgi:hypothetical protein
MSLGKPPGDLLSFTRIRPLGASRKKRWRGGAWRPTDLGTVAIPATGDTQDIVRIMFDMGGESDFEINNSNGGTEIGTGLLGSSNSLQIQWIDGADHPAGIRLDCYWVADCAGTYSFTVNAVGLDTGPVIMRSFSIDLVTN